MGFPKQSGQGLLKVIRYGGALRQALGIFGAGEGEDYRNEGTMARAGTGIAVGDSPEELARLEMLGGGAEGFEEADDFGGQAPGEHGTQAGQLALEQGGEDGVQEALEGVGADDLRRDRLQGRRYSPVWVRVVDGGDHRVVADRGTGDRCRCPGFQSQVQEPLTTPWSTGAPLDSEKHE